MMISKEQARAAAQDLRSRRSATSEANARDISPEVFAAAYAVAESTPDANPQRVAAARSHLAGTGADSRAVASMMIQRIISDSLR